MNALHQAIQRLNEYRFLLMELTKRDFKRKYKRTVFGMLWSAISPLLTLLVMKLVFTQFFGHAMEHYTTYLFAGNLVFAYFNDATSIGMNSLVGNKEIFSKVNVPKYMFVVASNASSFVNFCVTFLVFFIFVAVDGIAFGLSTPTITSVSRYSTQTVLNWVTVMNADGYYLYQSATYSGYYYRVGETSGATFTDTGISNGSGYYKLRAYHISDRGVIYVGPFSIGVPATAAVQRRAFVIGQDYSNSYISNLYGTINDANGIKSMLQNLSDMDYSVVRQNNLTKSGILSGISSAFSGAGTDDVSLFYYSGHGSASGDLVGTDFYSVGGISPTELRNQLDTIPGTKIVIVDCCYSGTLIDRSAIVSSKAAQEGANSFVNSFVSAFSNSGRSSLATGGYYVITACSSTQTSAEGIIPGSGSSKIVGYFTYPLTIGCGWNYLYNTATSKYADSNSDGSITLSELYSYTYNRALSYNEYQQAQVYPSGSSYVLFTY